MTTTNPGNLDPNTMEFISVEMPQRLLNFAFVTVDDAEMVGITDGVSTIEVPRKTMPMFAIGAGEVFDMLADDAEESGVPLPVDPDSERAMVRDAWADAW